MVESHTLLLLVTDIAKSSRKITIIGMFTVKWLAGKTRSEVELFLQTIRAFQASAGCLENTRDCVHESSHAFVLALMSSLFTLMNGPCDLWTSHYREHVTRIEPSAVIAVCSVPEVRGIRWWWWWDLSRNIIKQCLNILISFVKPPPSPHSITLLTIPHQLN